jgi:hypothetical protein
MEWYAERIYYQTYPEVERVNTNRAVNIGEVKLNNLLLKKEALDKFDLPIDVLRGEVHRKLIR